MATSKKNRTQTIYDSNNQPVTITIRRDKRLKKSARWHREPDGTILLRIPYQMPTRYLDDILEDVAKSLTKMQQRAQARTDADLQARAKLINRKYFNNEIQWAAIRWVSNMEKRLGSCTNGGSTDGHIRISDRINTWPEWVVDYVIAHELAHRIHPNHSRDFWAYLEDSYPLTERARGFILGVGFAQQETFDEDDF